MKHLLKTLILILIPFISFSQSLGKSGGKTRIAPTTQIRKGTKPRQVLMTRTSDSSLVYTDLDTIIKDTDIKLLLSVVNDSIRIDSFDNKLGGIVGSPQFIDDAINKPDLVQGTVNNLQLNSGVIERGNLLQGGSQPADFTRNIYNWLGTTYKDHWQSSGDSELFSINGSQTINPTNTTNSGTGAINIGIGAVNGNYKLNIGGAIWLDNGRGSVMIGNTAGSSSTSSNSVYIGGSAGAVESGNNCISIGNATAAFSNGDNNLTFGYLSGFSNNGTNNIQMGSFENSRNSVGNDNISLGTQTLRDNIGSNLVAIGSFTATNNTGSGSVIIGGSAGQSNSGSNGIIIGTLAGVNNTGNLATLVGHSAGYNNKGFQVSALGYSAGKNIKLNADYNTTFGAFSGMEYGGIKNSSFGYLSGGNVSNTASFLSLFGASSGDNNTGNNCTLIGAVGVGQNNTGDHVTAIGTGNYVDGQGRVTARNNTGDFAIAVGAAALENNQSDKTIGIGVRAGDIGFGSISEGSIAIGTEAARQFDISPTSSIHRIAIGTNAMDIYKGGNYSIAIGYKALSNNNGDHVIAIGKNAGDTNAQPNRFIISNDELPSFPDRATALASITVALGAAVNNTYLYYNASNGAIEAVRL